jgi:hypothetical protein
MDDLREGSHEQPAGQSALLPPLVSRRSGSALKKVLHMTGAEELAWIFDSTPLDTT